MTKEELRSALYTLGLNQSEFARLIGVEPRQVRRWVAGDTVIIPGPVTVLVRLWLMRPELVEVVRGNAGTGGAEHFREAA